MQVDLSMKPGSVEKATLLLPRLGSIKGLAVLVQSSQSDSQASRWNLLKASVQDDMHFGFMCDIIAAIYV
jgi:hypothetical protein